MRVLSTYARDVLMNVIIVVADNSYLHITCLTLLLSALVSISQVFVVPLPVASVQFQPNIIIWTRIIIHKFFNTTFTHLLEGKFIWFNIFIDIFWATYFEENNLSLVTFKASHNTVYFFFTVTHAHCTCYIFLIRLRGIAVF